MRTANTCSCDTEPASTWSVDFALNLTCPRPHSDLNWTHLSKGDVLQFYFIFVIFVWEGKSIFEISPKNLISTPKNEIHIRTATLSKNLESQITILEYLSISNTLGKLFNHPVTWFKLKFRWNAFVCEWNALNRQIGLELWLYSQFTTRTLNSAYQNPFD